MAWASVMTRNQCMLLVIGYIGVYKVKYSVIQKTSNQKIN